MDELFTVKQTDKEIQSIKSAVRKRDKLRCTKCRMTNRQHRATYNKSLEVHRLEPGSVYGMAECVTLCRPCHAKEVRRPMGSVGGQFLMPRLLAIRLKVVAIALNERSARSMILSLLERFVRDNWPHDSTTFAELAPPTDAKDA